ncbi:MAG: tripartite tricarboxylate transporter substrate binding protein [Usitatibacter sp.]
MIAAWRNIGLALAAAVAFNAAAQYPDRVVKLVVPFAAGGFTDSVARIVGQELQKKWGQPVVVENRPGAGGNIGAEVVAKSAPDGYTLFLATNTTHAINGTLYRVLPFDPVKDFDPVVLLVTTPNLLVVGPTANVNSVKELIAAAKADPKRFNYGSTGVGSSVHLQAEQFKSQAGIQMTHIPYKGSSQALTDLIGGSVQVMFDNLLFQMPQVKGGKVKALAITARNRTAQLPDVPTMSELGIPGFETGPWFAIVAPAKTPAAIVAKINADVNEALKLPEVIDKLKGAEIIGGTPQEFAAFMSKETAKWGKLIRELDLKAD